MSDQTADGSIVKLLITGAAGFVGTALVARLSDSARYSVTGSVRHRSGALPESIQQSILGDLSPETDWRQTLQGRDTVVHLAARAHVMRGGAEQLAEFRRINVQCTLNLARQAAGCGVRRLVFVSSIGVNGTATGAAPYCESDQPHPSEPYAVSKWEAEDALRVLSNSTGMELVIVRPPLVYGPHAPGNFGRLIRVVRRGIPLPFGAVRNRRSLVGLQNLVDFIVICMEHPSAANETFIVSDGEDLSTPDLIRRLARAMGRPSRLIPVPSGVLMVGAALVGRRAMAQRLIGSLQVDSSKARRILGWAPPISVAEGLRRAAGDRR
jgi:nucleoside-diphosphate-sugar epimerase